MNKPAALYARVSSDRQKENHTIASQVAALMQFAETNGYLVPSEWQFQDDGYSGATSVRPGLEALRDLAAAGEIQTVLIYSPDRLSRKYAYQVLLAEELARCGVELIFLRAPSGATAEDQLLVQFQGMIAEYERAQIAERSRRGKRHRAQQGSINVLSGAPYGYRYVKKTDTSAAYYEVVESEAEVVRLIFDAYTRQGLSIGAIVGLLNQREVPTRTRRSRWERPTLWRMLHNPAYAGHAFYGKTELRPRRRITRRLRERGLCSRDSSFRERPRPEWIEIPVPALVSEATFALAQEQFEKNKRFSPRRTIEPSLLQGLLVCQRCGYGLYRASTRTSQRTIYYYRCLGRDGYRHLKGAVCDSKPIRQEQLDTVVWQEIMRLLEDPSLLQGELDRRLQAAQITDPLKRREDALRRDQARLTKSMERLLTGFQENLITLEELRCRMPELRKQQRAIEAELQSLEMTAVDPTRNLRLVESLAEFRTRLRSRGNVLEVAERQRVVRLLVREILVDRDNITIRHSIPMPASSPDSNHGVRPSHEPPEPNTGPSYLLRSNSQVAAECHIRAYEHAIAAGHRQTHALVMRVSQAYGKAASSHFGREVERAEHLHSVRRYRILIVHNSNVAKPESFDQCPDDLVMGDRTVRFGCCWRGHQHQFFTADGSAAIANERTSF